MADFYQRMTGNGSLFGNSGFWASKAREMYMSHSPFQDSTNWRETLRRVFQKMGEARDTGRYYDAMVPSPEQYKRIGVPILTSRGIRR